MPTHYWQKSNGLLPQFSIKKICLSSKVHNKDLDLGNLAKARGWEEMPRAGPVPANRVLGATPAVSSGVSRRQRRHGQDSATGTCPGASQGGCLPRGLGSQPEPTPLPSTDAESWACPRPAHL